MNVRNVFSIPSVIEETSHGEKGYDIYTRLLKDRVVFVDGEIRDEIADAVIAQLLFLQSQDPERDISMYINSPGGSVTAGLAIYDTMKFVRPDIQTICVGQAASMGAVLLGAGANGKRSILPSARVLIHQPWGGVQGQATDIGIQAKEIVRLKKMLIKYLSEDTGNSEEKIAADLERDLFMSSDEAVEYGIVDTVLKREQNGKNKG